MQRITLTAALILAASLAAPTPLPAQDLLFSSHEDVAGPPAFLRAEVLRLDPAAGTLRFLGVQALDAMVGDADGNGLWDDGPSNIDALAATGPGVGDWLLSTAVTLQLPGPGSLRDGDVFRLGPSGTLEVVYGESFFEGATGTSGVDVDALAIGPAGEIYFSFAQDESTTVPSLIAQNGGVSVMDEQTVFRLDPGQGTAVIHFTKLQVTSFFSQALGGTFTTVVDVIGLAPDPAGAPGDLLITCASQSSALEGRVITSRAGGQTFSLGGQTVDSQMLVGAVVPLDALGFTQGPGHPDLAATNTAGSAAAGSAEALLVSGLAPGEPFQFVVTEPVMAGPPAVTSAALAGFGAMFLDPTHPMWVLSQTVPTWTLVADPSGRASYAFSWAGLVPGTRAVVQGVGLTSLLVSNPVVLAVTP